MKEQQHPPFHFALLIPCFNNLEGLLRSLRSVQYPSHLYTIIVIDDASTKPFTAETLRTAFAEPPRIEILRNATNLGITASLNKGLLHISRHIPTRYIARLDAGDICSPERFTRQVSFLEENPGISLLGAWCRFIQQENKHQYTYRSATTDMEIRREMHLKCSFIHPTVMFRKKVLEKVPLYPDEFPHAEDYAFFWEILYAGKGAVLNEVLVDCEWSGSGISGKNRRKQMISRFRIVQKFGSSTLLKITGGIRIGLLLLIPYRITLILKKN